MLAVVDVDGNPEELADSWHGPTLPGGDPEPFSPSNLALGRERSEVVLDPQL
jgi:hypothetical protein